MKNNYRTPRITFLQAFFTLLCTLSITLSGFSQGANCAAAEPITVNGACDDSRSGLSGTDTNGPSSLCMASFRNEGWWVFTVTGGPLDITITADNLASANLSLSAFSGACASLTEIGCENAGTSNASLTLYNLSNGTYYFQGQYANGTGGNRIGNICVSGTPACGIPTLVATTNIGGTSATINWNAATPVPANGYEYIVSTDNSTATPGNDITGTTTNTTANITGLNPSTTYYVFVRSDCGSGVYSAWSPSNNFTTTVAGNIPCDAISLTNNPTCTTIAGTNVGTTGSGVPAPTGCAPTIGYSGSDVWFETTASANGTLEVSVFKNGGMNDPVLAIYRGTCGSLSLLDCDDDSAGNLEPTETVTGLTPGEPIFIRVWDWNGTGDGTFEICANPAPDPPANDLCSGAIDLPCGTIDMSGTSIGATNVAHNTGCTMSNYGVWYTFTGDGNLSTITVQPDASYDPEIAIVSGTCGAFTNIACVDGGFSGGDTETYSFVTTPGVRYYVYIAHWFSGDTTTGDFRITRTCQTVEPPPNDDPCNAVDLIVNDSCVSTGGTTQYATGTAGVPNPTCSGYNGGDVWYTVTVPPNANITIATQSGVVTDSGMAVYSGNCSGTLTQIRCENDSGMTSITLGAANGIVPGQVLYVRVWETGNNNNGTFGICATSPVPPGTNGVSICAGSPSAPLTTDLFCNTGATSPYPLSGTLSTADPQAPRLPIFHDSNDPCAFDGSAIRYYDTIDFTVTATGTYVFEISAPFDSMGYIVEQGFTPGNCGSGTFIAGDDDNGDGLLSQITATLTEGVTYTLITTHFSAFASLGSYTWTVDLTVSSAQWYDAETGGNLVGLGAFFDPVTAGVLADTDTPGTYSFWVACDDTSTRTEAQFVISSAPNSITLSGAPLDCNNYEITVTVDEPDNTTGWYIEYHIDGGSGIAIDDGSGFLTSSPYTFTISSTEAPAGSVITLGSAFNVTNFCPSINNSGSATTSYNCACVTWNGSVNTDWFIANNWTPSGIPDSSDCVVIPDTSSGSGNDPFICGTCNADAGSITVENGGILTLFPNGTLTVQDEVTVIPGGVFELQGNQQDAAQLIQVNNATNSGSISLFRETNVRTRDYVYWSSPVENFPVTGIAPTTPVTLIHEWIPTIPGNPGTHGDWANTTENMIPGKGYIVRGPNGNGNTNDTATWNTILFTGVPHNGTIIKAIERGNYTGSPINGGGGTQVTNEDDNWNLVGNPYPSALDARDFLTLNTNLDGTVYLWTHGTRIQQGQGSPFYGNYVYNYNIDDYLEYNLSGPSVQGGFNGYIGSGQGFFVQMLHAAATPSTVEFNNSMRDRTNDNSQFFRNANTDTNNDLERHRIWLDLVEPSGNTNTTLVAYVEGATMERDRLFDGITIGGSGKNLYSMLEDKPFIIQGRALPFDDTDSVPIGINVQETGVFALAIHGLDGLFETTPQEIYINDLETGIIHNLKEAPYFFTLDEPGEYNNRFLLQYQANALGIDLPALSNSIQITAPESRYIKITSASQPIDQVLVYDLLGRVLITHKDVNAQELTLTEVPEASGTYLVKAVLQNGSKKVQKVIIK